MSKIKTTVALLAGALFASAASAWTPDKPVEFVVTAGAGGGCGATTGGRGRI